jgi:multiple sugar transport system permease protein
MKKALIALILAGALLLLLPFGLMVSGSLMGAIEGQSRGNRFIPHTPTFEAYTAILSHPVPRWFANTLFIGVTTQGAGVCVALGAAFAISKYEFRWKNGIFGLILLGLLIPGQLMIVPMFLVVRSFGLYNTIWAAIVPRIVAVSMIWFLVKYLRALPDSVIDAGRIDGLGGVGLLWHVVAPLTVPAVIALVSIGMVGVWADYLWPLIVLRKEELMTLALGVREVVYVQSTLFDRVSYGGTGYMGVSLAGAVIASVPGFVLFLTVQKYFVTGLFAKTGGK